MRATPRAAMRNGAAILADVTLVTKSSSSRERRTRGVSAQDCRRLRDAAE
jgi:hypothetical protein